MKTAKKLVIGSIIICRQLTQFFELGLGQFYNHVKPNIRVTRPGKIASGVNVRGGHIQGRQFLGLAAEIQRVITSVRPKSNDKYGQIYKAKGHFLVPVLLSHILGSDSPNVKNPYRTSQPTLRPRGDCVQRIWARKMSTFGNNLIERFRTALVHVRPEDQLGEIIDFPSPPGDSVN